MKFIEIIVNAHVPREMTWERILRFGLGFLPGPEVDVQIAPQYIKLGETGIKL